MMESIRKMYGVPAKRGMRVFYTHNECYGTIKSSSGSYLKIQLDGEKRVGNYHPTWKLEYLNSDGEVIYSSEKHM